MIPIEEFCILISYAHGANHIPTSQARFVLSEQVPCAGHKNVVLGIALVTVPPPSNGIRKENTKEDSIEQKDKLSISFRDDKFGQGDTNAEALFSVRVAELDVVVSDFFVCECLVCLCKFDETFVEHLNGFIFCRVGLDLVWVEFDGKAFIVFADSSLIRALNQ